MIFSRSSQRPLVGRSEGKSSARIGQLDGHEVAVSDEVVRILANRLKTGSVDQIQPAWRARSHARTRVIPKAIGAEGGNRTHTPLSGPRILSPSSLEKLPESIGLISDRWATHSVEVGRWSGRHLHRGSRRLSVMPASIIPSAPSNPPGTSSYAFDQRRAFWSV
jgi:hypothetical protein